MCLVGVFCLVFVVFGKTGVVGVQIVLLFWLKECRSQRPRSTRY